MLDIDEMKKRYDRFFRVVLNRLMCRLEGHPYETCKACWKVMNLVHYRCARCGHHDVATVRSFGF